MKKNILVLTLILFTSSLYALDCSVEAGWQYRQVSLCNEFTDDLGDMFIEIGLYQDFSIFTFYGIYKNELSKDWGIYFMPKQDTYTVGASVTLGDFTINAEHQCSHKVDAYRTNNVDLDMGHNRISVKYSNR